MKILQKKSLLLPIHVAPGDTLNLWYHDGDSDRLVASEKITEAAVYDTAVIVEIENGELGLEFGIGGVFGKKLRDK